MDDRSLAFTRAATAWRLALGIATIAVAATITIVAIAALRFASAPLGNGGAEAGSPVPGCETATSVPSDDAPFTSVSTQFGSPVSPPIGAMGKETSSEALAALGAQAPSVAPPPGLSLQLVLTMEEDFELDGRPELVVRNFYSSEPVDLAEPLPSFYSKGGVLLTQVDTIGKDADRTLAELRENGRTPLPPTVAISQYEAVLIHSDPLMSDDLRPFHLYWSDGTYDLSLIGNANPVLLVNTARSLHCAG